jgi:Uncharacterized protein conserved in bacteria
MRKTLNLVLIALLVCLQYCSRDHNSANSIVKCPEITGTDLPMGVPGNTVITITGKNFGTNASAVAVFFNGIQATINSLADAAIKVIVPLNAATGKISVVINNCPAKSQDDFIIITQAMADKWKRRADFPYPIISTVSFSINGKGYVATGYNEINSIRDLHEYNPLTNQWIKKSDKPGDGRSGATIIVADSKAYFIAGNGSKDFFEYNPATDQWKQKTDFPGAGRGWAKGFSINNKLYFGIGSPLLGEQFKDWWEYDPVVDQWSQKANFPGTAVRNGNAISINDKGYLGLGAESGEWWQYDAVADTWTRKKDLPGPVKFGAVSFSFNGKGYIIAGATNACWEYDPVTDNWTSRIPFFTSRSVGAGFVIGSKAYFGTGASLETYILTKDFWEFDPTQ